MLLREERSNERKSKFAVANREALRSSGKDSIEFGVEQFFRRTIAEAFSRQGFDQIGKNHDFIGSVIIDTLAIREESPKYQVMIFHRPFLKGRIGMRKEDFDSDFFQIREICKFGTDICRNRLEHLGIFADERLKQGFQRLVCRLRGKYRRFIPLFDNAVDFPMSEFFSAFLCSPVILRGNVKYFSQNCF